MLLMPGAQAYDRTVDGLPPIECHNAYPERTPGEIGANWVVTTAPGEVLFYDAGAGDPRGMFSSFGVFNGDVFALTGDTLRRINSAGVATDILTGVAGADQAYFTSVRGSLVMSVGGLAYVYDGTTTTQITDPDLPTVGSLAAMDGRIIFMEDGIDRIWWSGIFDPANIDALAFATAETFEDTLVRIVADHREIWLFGQQTIEIWRPVGDPEQPFQRVGGMVLQMGTLSPYSVVAMDNTLYWVGYDKIVYKAAGSGYERVSNHGIERALAELTDAQLASVTAFSYTDQGHKFYVLDIPGGGTYFFDASTGQWHTRGDTLRAQWGVKHAIEAFSKTYVQRGSAIYELTRTAASNAAGAIEPIVSVNIPSVAREPIQRLGAVCAALSTTGAEINDIDAFAFSFSDDAGRSYSAEEIIKAHPQGSYTQRVQLFRQGQMRSPGRVYRVRGINADGATRFMFGPMSLNNDAFG